MWPSAPQVCRQTMAGRDGLLPAAITKIVPERIPGVNSARQNKRTHVYPKCTAP